MRLTTIRKPLSSSKQHIVEVIGSSAASRMDNNQHDSARIFNHSDLSDATKCSRECVAGSRRCWKANARSFLSLERQGSARPLWSIHSLAISLSIGTYASAGDNVLNSMGPARLTCPYSTR